MRSTPIQRRAIGNGPDGQGGGMLLCNESALCKYTESRTKWRSIPGNSHGVMIGYDPNNLPTPDDLRRNKLLVGRSLEINGNNWEIPIGRSFADLGDEILPVDIASRYFDLDDSGEWTFGGIATEYQAVFDVCLRYTTHLMALANKEEDGALLTNDMAVILLQANYRVAAIEVAILQLFSRDTISMTLDYSIDLPQLEVLQKKKRESDTSNTSVGESAGASPNGTRQLQSTSSH